MSRTVIHVGALMWLCSAAQAGVVVELVPDNPGPYFGGESMTVDVWLHSEVSWPVFLRNIQFDFSNSDPAIVHDSAFTFNFSAVPSGGGGYIPFLHPELPVPRAFQGLDCFCPGEYFQLLGNASLLIGSIGIELPRAPGSYGIDTLNADEPDELFGAAIRTVWPLLELPLPTFCWRAFNGDIKGGAHKFIVIPEATTGMLLFVGMLWLLSLFPPRSRRPDLERALVLAGVLACASWASAQPMPVPAGNVPADVDSGVVSAPGSGGGPSVVFSQILSVPDAPWVRLHFSLVTLSGSRAEDNESFLRITSLQDGAVQILDSETLGTWAGTTAFFNGDGVLLELLAYPETGNSQLAVDTIAAGAREESQGGGEASGGPCSIDDRKTQDSYQFHARPFAQEDGDAKTQHNKL